jgi:hypothetical protein
MKMLLKGEWVDRPEKSEVRNPQDDSLVDMVPRASTDDMRQAIEAATHSAKQAKEMPVHQCMKFLNRGAGWQRFRRFSCSNPKGHWERLYQGFSPVCAGWQRSVSKGIPA